MWGSKLVKFSTGLAKRLSSVTPCFLVAVRLFTKSVGHNISPCRENWTLSWVFGWLLRLSNLLTWRLFLRKISLFLNNLSNKALIYWILKFNCSDDVVRYVFFCEHIWEVWGFFNIFRLFSVRGVAIRSEKNPEFAMAWKNVTSVESTTFWLPGKEFYGPFSKIELGLVWKLFVNL